MYEPTISLTSQELFELGYRQVSRKYRTVARVDISEAQMLMHFINENFGNIDSSVISMPLDRQRDFYRRCCSRDKHTVSEITLLELNKLVNN